MHNRERVSEPDEDILNRDITPALFVLETVYRGARRVVADGVAFPPPNENVVVCWRNGSIELIDTVDAMYEKFGRQPRVMWWHDEDTLAEVEPQEFMDAFKRNESEPESDTVAEV